MPAILTEQFGRYKIVKRLGAGGMGEVYLAHDTQMDRPVALKVPQLEGRDTDIVLEQFYREARIVAKIRHPGVCPLYDVGSLNGIHFLTMAFIEGNGLDKVIRTGGRKPVFEAVELVVRVAEALQQLHAHGIVHRDLKPGNVIVQPDGSPVLLDFGLARSLTSQSQAMGSHTAATGTPAYMAPEQVAGQAAQIKPWTDVYALGVILFELLTGRLPFEALNAVHYSLQVLQAARPRPSEFAPGIPPALDALCLSMMSVDVAQRPATMAETIQRLQGVRGASSSSNTDVSTRCPNCGKRVRITGSMAGKKVLCPGCKTRLDAPLDVPLTQTAPLQETMPTSEGQGFASVTVVDPAKTVSETDLATQARVRKLGKITVWVCGVAAVLLGFLIVMGNQADESRVLNFFLAGIFALILLPLAGTAWFTRRSLRTGQVVLITSSVMVAVATPVIVGDFYFHDNPRYVGMWVFFLSAFYLLVDAILIPGLLIAKLVRWARRPKAAPGSPKSRPTHPAR